MVNQYDETSEALQAARASAFSLDITDADFYSLELGLQTVSDETGGSSPGRTSSQRSRSGGSKARWPATTCCLWKNRRWTLASTGFASRSPGRRGECSRG